MSDSEFLPDAEAVSSLIALFEKINPDSRERLLHVLETYYGIRQTLGSKVPSNPKEVHAKTAGEALANFTEDRSLSAKEFMLQKQPRTDVERVACLAYYLTHYMNTPHFKSVDISRLNTEAAQIKFSNPAFAVVNATNQGYLTQAGKGFKQISALGEQFVIALPDREAAKAAMAAFRRRRSPRTSKNIDSRSG